jgi:hypothetical protein
MQRDSDLVRDSLRTAGNPVPLVVDSPATLAPAMTPAPVRELALGSAAVGELDDRELLALLEELETIEVLPSADVETSSVVPAAAGTE